MHHIKIIDCLGPFFSGKEKMQNWSKIPFAQFESRTGDLDTESLEYQKTILDFEHIIKCAHSYGYNAISLDDAVHLSTFPSYPKDFQQKLNRYKALYERCFSIAKKYKFKIFINYDLISLPTHFTLDDSPQIYAQKVITEGLNNPSVDGLILRFGESDANDVQGDFKSQPLIKTSRDLNHLLEAIAPIAQGLEKQCILRTWSVGVGPIGDLSWNFNTLKNSINTVAQNPSFVLSLKPSETDFYTTKYINPIFKDIAQNFPKLKCILETQSAPERGGFGELHPLCMGWEYASLFTQAKKQNPNFIGIMAWAQTGGWTQTYLRPRTFIDSISWSALNTYLLSKLWDKTTPKDDKDLHDTYIEKLIGAWLSLEAKTHHLPWAKKADLKLLKEYLYRYYRIYIKILYPKSFVVQKKFFRRFMVPPLMWMHWDQIKINPLVISLYLYFGTYSRKERLLLQQKVDHVCALAKKLNLPNHEFQESCLRLFLAIRTGVLKGFITPKLHLRIKNFNRKYPQTYGFDIKDDPVNSRFLKLAWKILLRKKHRYRTIDKIFMLPVISDLLGNLIIQRIPPEDRDQCMGIIHVLKD